MAGALVLLYYFVMVAIMFGQLTVMVIIVSNRLAYIMLCGQVICAKPFRRPSSRVESLK